MVSQWSRTSINVGSCGQQVCKTWRLLLQGGDALLLRGSDAKSTCSVSVISRPNCRQAQGFMHK